jgi:DNA-binding IclR family transcriptional regulator
MSLAVLDAHETAMGLAVTFITDAGLEPLEGTREQVAHLARAMEQVSVLAALNEREKVWLEDVEVGDATVRLGLSPGGQARVRIVRR